MRRMFLQIVEAALFGAALCCAGVLYWSKFQAIPALRAASTITPALSAKVVPGPPRNGVLGRIEIPAIGLVVPLVPGADSDALRRGAGYLQGTALPGGLGNFAVAAHRDSFFRPLRNIRPGMLIRVVTPDQSFLYSVDRTRVVDPEDVAVLDTGDVPQMTLITCYPFSFIGAAPKRFVVTAHLLSL